MKNLKTLVYLLSLAVSASAFANFDCQPDFELKGLSKNLKENINKVPTKFGPDCQKVKTSHSFLFTDEQVENKEFVDAKDSVRKKFKMEIFGQEIRIDSDGRAGIANNDKAENLVDNRWRMIKTLKTMEKKSLKSGQVETLPWSDDYWAIAKGILAYRYADDVVNSKAMEIANNNETDHIWKLLNEFMKAENLLPGRYVLDNNTDKLSPSEKYDLLVGDKNYSFTKFMWEQGRPYYEEYNKVESWMGICHGWAPAAYMLPRPVKSVTVTAVDGKTKVKFTPADLKALGSQLWATTQTKTNFIGGRCNTKEPKEDENGRIIDQDCFDNNPGSWHLAVVNQIGIAKRSMVMDATYDYEVWNHPIVSYSYKYFNPVTEEYTDTLEKATVAKDDYKADKFKTYRDAETKSIVGIVMEVKYAVETQPEVLDYDNEYRDAHHTVHYIYDLELNARGSIIGGEWYSNKHPDFLWTPVKGEKAMSMYEDYLEGDWNPANDAFPKQWAFFAPQIKVEDRSGRVQTYTGTSEKGQPFGKAVRALFELASKKDE